jgi:gas vesicle protein
MFNSKKIQKMLQQQELLDAKINSLAHGQKSLAEDFEVHFKRLRQSIYTSVEEFSSELQDKMSELNKELEAIKKQIVKFQDPSRLLKEESEIIKKQNGIINENIARMRNSLQIDFDLVKDQIKDLNNQVAITKSQIHLGTPIEVTPIGVGGIGVPTWSIANGTSDSSPIQDKMKLQVADIFDDSEKPRENKKSARRKPTKPIEERKSFSVNVTLPEKILNYLHNRSSEKAISATCRNVFERDGKLVFAPLSNEIAKNFVTSTKKVVTIEVSKNTYLAIRKIAKDMNIAMTQVASNFVATMDYVEATEIALIYSTFNSKELQTKTSAPRRGVGRPKKK